ncbi:MAG: exonuclease domain-containing protein [Acidimicrobiia bacterium]
MKATAISDLGTPLISTTFVALDLETTGAAPCAGGITEIGAIKSVAGVVEGTLQTRVQPDHPIPGFIAELTGIDNNMVSGSPDIAAVLPSLYEFLRGTVLVAHNASFDSSFLTAAFDAHGYEIPFTRSVCTLKLARRLVRADVERLGLVHLVVALKLSSDPCHRAMPDAQAALDVLHRMLEIGGSLGILTLEDLFAFLSAPHPDLKRLGMTASIPRVAGSYKFFDARGRLLHEGHTKNLRGRVRSYFYGHSRMKVGRFVRRVASIEWERASG